jgi:hypothetical protein
MPWFGTSVLTMPTGLGFRVGLVALLAPAGVLCGHELTYLLAIPDPDRRATMLGETGHGWWAAAVPVGAALAVAAIVWVLTGCLRCDDGDRLPDRETASWLISRLAACQLVLFIAIETVERLATGHALGDLAHHELVEHGVFGQIVVALLLTASCWCLAVAVELVCARTGRPSPHVPARGVPFAGRESASPRSRPRRPWGARAPPPAR